MKKKCLVIYSILLLISAPSFAQGHRHDHSDGRARHHNFYHKVNLSFGNLYGFALSSCLTGVINYLIDDAMFETGFGYPIYREKTVSPYRFSRQNMLGVERYDLLHNFDGGIRLGYQTYNPRFVNVGFCALAQYKYEPFLLMDNLGGEQQAVQSTVRRVLLGGNFMLFLGKMSMDTRVELETGLRYSLGMGYVNPVGASVNALNNGLVSHYALSIGGPGYFQNIKFFADVTHFNLIQNDHISLSPIYVGLSWTVTPKQSDYKR